MSDASAVGPVPPEAASEPVYLPVTVNHMLRGVPHVSMFMSIGSRDSCGFSVVSMRDPLRRWRPRFRGKVEFVIEVVANRMDDPSTLALLGS